MWHAWKMTTAHRDFEEKPEGKNPFGRPRHRRQDNIEIYLKQILR